MSKLKIKVTVSSDDRAYEPNAQATAATPPKAGTHR